MYGRAHATFNDPNVLGAFLVLPALLALQRVLNGRLGDAFARVRAVRPDGDRGAAHLLARRLGAVRADHGAPDVPHLRHQPLRAMRALRIVLIAIAGVIVMVLVLAALLSIDRVADLFKERAEPRAVLRRRAISAASAATCSASQLALDRPFGIGPLQFTGSSPRTRTTPISTPSCPAAGSPACVYLDAGADHAVARPALPCSSTRRGARPISRSTAPSSARRPKACIIDSDHWRHYFLLLGVIWGLMAASRPYARRRLGAAPDAAAAAPLRLRPPGVEVRLESERSAARLAHQSGGLGVPSSNLGAPTNKIKDLA